jgi:hypothetical protein
MRKFSLVSNAALIAGLATAGCTGDDPLRPDPTSPSYARSSTSQGLARAKPVGDPIWRPVDFHLFTAPIGTFESGFAEFVALTEQLLPPPNHIPLLPVFGVGPGTPHDPPYDRELAEGVDANGLQDRHSFPASAFSAELGNGVYLVWMLVPDPGVTGRSPDFSSGPIIPNSLFPIVVSGIATRNGQPFDPFLVPGLVVPPLDERVAPQFAGMEGHSHLPIFIADNQAFAIDPNTPLTGRYRYELTMRDQAGNGWDITAQFIVRKQ